MDSTKQQPQSRPAATQYRDLTVGHLLTQFGEVRWSAILADLPDAIIEKRLPRPQIVPTDAGTFFAEMDWEWDRGLYTVVRVLGTVQVGDWSIYLHLGRTHEEAMPADIQDVGPRPWPSDEAPSGVRLGDLVDGLRESDWTTRPRMIQIEGQRWDCTYSDGNDIPVLSRSWWGSHDGDVLYMSLNHASRSAR